MVNWYYYLFCSKDKNKNGPSLFDTDEIINNSLPLKSIIVCQKIKYCQYAYFIDINDFIDYLYNSNKNIRCFYEIIPGNSIQKPHFDIDIHLDDPDNKNLDVQNLLDCLIDSILLITPYIKLERIAICSSNNDIVKSYHIIINDYHHNNNIEAKNYYKEIIKNIPEKYIKFIDSAVYSKTQQMRILHCSKYEGNRFKILEKKWLYKGTTIKFDYKKSSSNIISKKYVDFNNSIIRSGDFLGDHIKGFEDKKLNSNNIFNIENIFDIDIFSFLSEKIEDFSLTYQFIKEVNGFFLFKRLRPSYCSDCNRVHQHENAFAYIKKNNIYFNCRRGRSVNIHSYIEDNSEIDIKPIDIMNVEIHNKTNNLFR